ncbi:MAG: P-loop containing nucleoside triphosphate hydrolase protein [Podila humilis]|nr:MAG: P-loop containing nucleoside triphosphate hydrolase protein [Podila humilis]
MDKAYVIKSIPSNEKSGIDYAKVPGLAPRQEGECLLASSPEIEKQQLQTNRWNLGSLRTGLYIRIALIDLVFRKATTLSAQAHLLYPDGAIINLMTTDISRIDSAMMPMLIAFNRNSAKCQGHQNFRLGAKLLEKAGRYIREQELRHVSHILRTRGLITVTAASVIRACCLEQNLASIPASDLTEIGERSVSLSGGQKARLSLARSIYFNTGLEVMDAQLSAGDAHIGKRIWKQCVLGELKGRTRVIATHQLHVLPDVDIVICMKDSAISDSGLYSELMDKNGEFSELMGQYGGVDKKSAESAAGTSAANKLITEEERNTGAASTKVYAEYFKMVGWGFWTTVVMLYVTQQICGVMMKYWLSLWSAKE